MREIVPIYAEGKLSPNALSHRDRLIEGWRDSVLEKYLSPKFSREIVDFVYRD